MRKYAGGMRLPVTKQPQTIEILKTYWGDKKYTHGKIVIIFDDDDNNNNDKFYINYTHTESFSGIFQVSG